MDLRLHQNKEYYSILIKNKTYSSQIVHANSRIVTCSGFALLIRLWVEVIGKITKIASLQTN